MTANGKKKVTSVSLTPERVDWADENHALLGYSSRSEMIDSLLGEKKQEVEGDEHPEDDQ